MKKQHLLLVGAILLSFGVTACGQSESPDSAADPSTEIVTEVETEADVPSEGTEVDENTKREDGETFTVTYNVEGVAQEKELTAVNNQELGFCMGYDAENFNYEYDSESKVAAFTLKGQENAIYISIHTEDMSVEDAINGLELQAKGTPSRDKAPLAGNTVRTVIDDTKEGFVVYYVTEHNGKTYMIEQACTKEGEEGWGALLHCMLRTFTFIE